MESLNQLATKLQDRADNKADTERGKAILDAGEGIHFDELSEGDHILGVGGIADDSLRQSERDRRMSLRDHRERHTIALNNARHQ